MRTLLAAITLAAIALACGCKGPVIQLGRPPAEDDDDDDDDDNDDESDEDSDAQTDENPVPCTASDECSMARPYCVQDLCSECRSDADCDGGRCDLEDRECD